MPDDQYQFDDVPREAFLARLAGWGDEPDWKAEYAKLYAMLRNRFYQMEVAVINEWLAEIGAVARFTIHVGTRTDATAVRYEFNVDRADGSYCCSSFAHASFAKASADLFEQITRKLAEEAETEHNTRHEAESPAA